MSRKRMHPLKIVQSFFNLFKNIAIIFLYLFVLRFNETSTLLTIGRILFIGFIIYQLIAIFIEWFKTSYEIKNNDIHMYRGLFKRRHNRVSLESIQNIQRTTPFYFKLFGVTSLHLETSGADERSSVTFESIKVDEAKRIEKILESEKSRTDQPVDPYGREMDESFQNDLLNEIDSEQLHVDSFDHTSKNRTVVFQPSRKELIKASFLSLSFLIVIPVFLTIYENLGDFISLEGKLASIFIFIKESWFSIVVMVILIAIVLLGSGFIWTFLRYGKYEISSDRDHIYIVMGLLNERSLSIRKDNVQAIEIIQTPLKKWLNLCEIKLVSAENIDVDSTAISSFYPYMEKERAFNIIQELLPEFPIEEQMYRLPKKSFVSKMLRIPWLFIIACLIVLIWQESLWYTLPFLFIIIYFLRYFDYRNTRYLMDDENIQLKQGGLWSSWYITNRKRVVEIEVQRSFLQQRLGLATIVIVNRTKPYQQKSLTDIPVNVSKKFMEWYGNRYIDLNE